MTPQKKQFCSNVIGAALFFSFGLLLLWEAHHAQIHHTIIPGKGSKSAWMYPWQAYFASILCFAAAACAIVLGFRGVKK